MSRGFPALSGQSARIFKRLAKMASNRLKNLLLGNRSAGSNPTAATIFSLACAIAGLRTRTASPYLRLRQRHHAAPELLTSRGVDVVFAHEREPTVAGDAVDHDAGGERPCRVAVADRKRPNACRRQQPSARIDAEGLQVNAVPVNRLDEARFPGRASIANTATLFSPPSKTFLPWKSTSPWLRLVR